MKLENIVYRKKEWKNGFPFGGDTLVFKVMGKMFLLNGNRFSASSI
jgi:hypothetical protein